ncbi:hypothetical protein ACOSQ3_001649 [Xanthoceras sorbifolium]
MPIRPKTVLNRIKSNRINSVRFGSVSTFNSIIDVFICLQKGGDRGGHPIPTAPNKSKASKSNDSVLSEMISCMKLKFDKYWGKIEDVNKLLIIALVLDPRYKLDYVKFCFGDMFDDKKTEEMTCNVRELLIQLYQSYQGVDNISSGDHTSSSISFTNVDVEKVNENSNFRVERLKKKGCLDNGDWRMRNYQIYLFSFRLFVYFMNMTLQDSSYMYLFVLEHQVIFDYIML